MKKQCYAVCFAAFLSCAAYAQDNSSSVDTSVYTPLSAWAPSPSLVYKPLPEGSTQPCFRGGDEGLMRFLGSNINYPKQAVTNNIQGVVALSFVVEKDGSISKVDVLHDIGGGCAEESVRVVKAMPRWLPAMVEGAPVRVRYTLPVRFKLDEPKKPKKKKLSQRDSLFGN